MVGYPEPKPVRIAMHTSRTRLTSLVFFIIGIFVFGSTKASAVTPTATVGQSVTLSVTASGTSPFFYQWSKNGVNLSGATGSVYVISNVQAADAGAYSVVVSNAAGSTTSAPTNLMIGNVPAFTANPGAVTATAGTQAVFTVTAGGSPAPTYQWQQSVNGGTVWTNLSNDATHAGVTTASLQVTGLTTEINGTQFRCVATNSLGSTVSSAASLVVFTPEVSHTVGSDFNGDGHVDILWENPTTGAHLIWFMNGATYAGWADLGSQPTDWHIAAVADFNGDGQPDILWENPTTGAHLIWFMNGATYTGWADLGSQPTDWHVAAVADFNGDGQPDILWENPTTGAHLIWFMNGATYTGWSDLGSVPPAWHVAAVADFNGDGQPDILWENSSTGEHLIWFMNGATFAGWSDLGSVPTAWHVVN